MAEYIERESLLDRVYAVQDKLQLDLNNPFEDGVRIGFENVEIEIENYPAADVLEVVTCGECVYFRLNSCMRWADGTFMERTDFCSRAAKREES